MGSQQIMEELHIELVIFHDQHGTLGGPGFYTPPLDAIPGLLIGHFVQDHVAPGVNYVHRFSRLGPLHFANEAVTNS
jgi:hypothetical protein